MTMTLCVAEFSYACLPLYYTHVVGVTGTLLCLPNYIKKYLSSNYKLEKPDMYPIPSVYSSSSDSSSSDSSSSGDCRKIFPAKIIARKDHFLGIVQNIKE